MFSISYCSYIVSQWLLNSARLSLRHNVASFVLVPVIKSTQPGNSAAVPCRIRKHIHHLTTRTHNANQFRRQTRFCFCSARQSSRSEEAPQSIRSAQHYIRPRLLSPINDNGGRRGISGHGGRGRPRRTRRPNATQCFGGKHPQRHKFIWRGIDTT